MEEKIAEIIKLGMMVYREEDIAKGIARDICNQLGLKSETKAIPIEPPVIRQGGYRTILIDPPWDIRFIERKVRPNQKLTYNGTMTIEEITKLPVNELAADECDLFFVRRLESNPKDKPDQLGFSAGIINSYDIFTTARPKHQKNNQY